MSELVQVVPEEIVNPVTGELVPRHDVAALADAVQKIRGARERLNDALAAFNDALVQESAVIGTKTLHAGGYQIKVSADTEIEWDIDKLQGGLHEAGCPTERVTQLVTQIVSYKVNGTVARQLAGANPDYKAAIEAAQTRVPKRSYVTVKPA